MRLPPATCLLVAAFAVAAPATPASAVSDLKVVHGSQCVAAGSNTAAADLLFGSFGVQNITSADKLVVCPLPVDIESPWQTTGTDPTQVYVHYRTGNVSARMNCTIYTGSIAAQSGAVTSLTSVGGMQPANSVTNVLGMYYPKANWSGTTPPAPVVSMACLLGPKIKLGGIFVKDSHTTYVP